MPKWGKEARRRLSRKGQTPNLKTGTAAALKSPKSGPFESNVNAKTWYLKSPDGIVYRVRNLRLFVRENPELFPESTFEQAYCGIKKLAQTERGTIKPRPVYQYKGWRLVGEPLKDEGENQ